MNINDPEGQKVQICYSPMEDWLGKIGVEHASIKASCGTWGFYPKDLTVPNILWGPGDVKDDSNRAELSCIDTQMTECVDEECVCKKIKVSDANPPYYGIILYNCHSWVRQIISECQK